MEFDDLLIYIESLPSKKQKKFICNYLNKRRNKNNNKSKILNKVFYSREKKEIKITNKKEIKSKWYSIRNKTIDEFDYHLKEIKVIDVLRKIYNLYANISYENRNIISLEDIYILLVIEMKIPNMMYNTFIRIICNYFDINNLYYSMKLNSLVLKNYFPINLKIKVNKFLSDKELYEYYKSINRLDLLNIIYLKSISKTYTEIATIYQKSVTVIKHLYYEGFQLLILFFESDKGLEILLTLFKNNYLSFIDLKNRFLKYYLLIFNLFKNNIFNKYYKIYYDKFFECFFLGVDVSSQESKQNITNNKIISHNEFNRLVDNCYYYLLNKNIKISKNIIILSFLKIYKKSKFYYSFNSISEKDKCEYIKRNFNYNSKLEFSIIYQDLFNSKWSKRYYGYKNERIILRVCESFKDVFTINDVIKDLPVVFKTNDIREYIKRSKMYYQLSSFRFINKDLVDLTMDLKKLKEKYKIRSEVFLKKIKL